MMALKKLKETIKHTFLKVTHLYWNLGW